MVLIIRGAQVSVSNVRVDLRRGNIRVPEHLLDRANIRAVLNEVRRERMAKRVRRNVRQAALVRVFADEFVDHLPV